MKNRNKTAPIQGRIADGKNASAFSSCSNTRKTAVRQGSKPPDKRQP